jgi:serine phosphatase RsbU (regulator of sigma subunit)
MAFGLQYSESIVSLADRGDGGNMLNSAERQLPPDSYEGALVAELRNFREITSGLVPSSVRPPSLSGVEVAGVSLPAYDVLGGDHLIYIDFQRRFDLPRRIAEAEGSGLKNVAEELRKCWHRAGILLADVSGHRLTDAVIAAMLHQAFLLGTYYELDRFGRITTRLFEHLNQRFYETTAVNKYFTMIYGEVSDEGHFRFISAGHPHPLVYSREYRSFVAIPGDRLASFPPVGMFPSGGEFAEQMESSPLGFKPGYRVNKIDLLAPGDLVLLYTDGLSELASGTYISARLEELIGQVVNLPATEIAAQIKTDVLHLAEREDDVSFVVIKRSCR